MEQILIYLLKVNGLLIFFWIFYKLLLQKETFYTFNRFYFLGSTLMSFVLPLIYFTKIKEIIVPASNLQIVENKSNFLIERPEIIELKWYETIDWLLVIVILIAVISVIKVGIRIFKIVQLTNSIQKLEKHPTEKIIRITENDEHVYSFYKWIILPKKLLNSENCSVLIQHEKVHIKQKHTFDLVSLSFISDFFWFNPIIKLIIKNVNLNLEFMVDDEITKQENSYSYQKTLLNFNQNQEQNILTNAFNSSDLKQRILMLNTQKSKNMKKLKIALTAPILLAFFGLFQIETVAQVKTDKQENDFGDNKLILETLQKDIKRIQEDKKLFNEIVEKYKTTVDGKEISKQELKEYDNTKIKSVAVDFSDAEKDTQVNFITTGEEEVRSFTFGYQQQDMEIKVNFDGEFVDVKDLQNAFKFENDDNIDKKYDKIYINGKESTEKELEHFYGKERRASVKIKDRVLYVEPVKENKISYKSTTQSENVVYILNDKEINRDEFKKISPNDIESITVIKDKEAIAKYGQKAKDGILLIKTKDNSTEKQKALIEEKKTKIELQKLVIEAQKTEMERKKTFFKENRSLHIDKRNALAEKRNALAEKRNIQLEKNKAKIENKKSEIERLKLIRVEYKALAEVKKTVEIQNKTTQGSF